MHREGEQRVEYLGRAPSTNHHAVLRERHLRYRRFRTIEKEATDRPEFWIARVMNCRRADSVAKLRRDAAPTHLATTETHCDWATKFGPKRITSGIGSSRQFRKAGRVFALDTGRVFAPFERRHRTRFRAYRARRVIAPTIYISGGSDLAPFVGRIGLCRLQVSQTIAGGVAKLAISAAPRMRDFEQSCSLKQSNRGSHRRSTNAETLKVVVCAGQLPVLLSAVVSMLDFQTVKDTASCKVQRSPSRAFQHLYAVRDKLPFDAAGFGGSSRMRAGSPPVITLRHYLPPLALRHMRGDSKDLPKIPLLRCPLLLRPALRSGRSISGLAEPS